MGTLVAPVTEHRELGLATDHDLVAAVRRNDDRAFEQLYGRYQRRIAAYIYGMVNDYGRSEDITQEVFISALRRMRETERPIAFKPWIYEIAKNACIDQFRRSKRAEEVSFDAEDGVGAAENARLAATGRAPDAEIDAKQQLDDLCGAFGGLSETHHQILVLRELEGLSYREIGERMGLSRPSVESTLFRARRRLSEEYDELISGQRCVRIQTIIVGAGEGSLGARDQRRLARHVAHCQPCRREARLANLDAALLSRRPAAVVASRVAALSPFPLFARLRRSDDAVSSGTGAGTNFVATVSGPLSSVSEPLMAGWTKAAAAAATLIVAGAGAGAITTAGGDSLKGASPREASAVQTRDAADGAKAIIRKAPASQGAAVNRAPASRGKAAPMRSSAPGVEPAGSTLEAAPNVSTGPSDRGSDASSIPAPPSTPGVPSEGSSDENANRLDAVVVPADPAAEVEAKAYGINEDAGDTVKTVRDLVNGG